jgi:hypothetical protein
VRREGLAQQSRVGRKVSSDCNGLHTLLSADLLLCEISFFDPKR